jgi:hypothetical protein
MAVPTARSDYLERIFVWTVWSAMLLIALVCIRHYGRNIPLAEDWLLVSPLTGNEADLSGWLWAQNNEHRIPLPRLVLLALLKMTNGDFRAGMFFNAAALGVLSLFMILLAQRLRGRTSFVDAFFPIALLHIGNWPNLVWGWQLSFVLPTVMTCAAFLIIVFNPALASPGPALFTGFCLALLPSEQTSCLPLCDLAYLLWNLNWRKHGRKWINRFLIGARSFRRLLSCILSVMGPYWMSSRLWGYADCSKILALGFGRG